MSNRAMSLNQIRKNLTQLVMKWRDAEGYERGQAQEFVRDLLKAYGYQQKRISVFEARAKRSSTGQQGYIDALLSGLAIIEMKSKGSNLVAAETQALDYLESIPAAEQPRWVITSDFATIRVTDLAAETDDDRIITISLDELPHEAESLAFLAGYQRHRFGSKVQEEASINAAQLMADLYVELEQTDYRAHPASVLLVRILFCLYADDAGVWGNGRDLFTEFIETRTNTDGSDLGPQLQALFEVLNTPEDERSPNMDEAFARFDYVNGGVFDNLNDVIPTPWLNKSVREKLLQCCRFNWAAISPAIFGSLFQAVQSKEARRKLGEHYTTETNILKTINPLFMDDLRAEFTENLHNTSGLQRLHRKLEHIRVMDPACGCGNFLVVSYRELRQLEIDIIERIQELNPREMGQTNLFARELLTVVHLDAFAGIEISEWPTRIAATALHLVEHQMNQAMELTVGVSPDLLPLDKVRSIHQGNSLRYDWSLIFPDDAAKTTYIVGNPPFIGQSFKEVDQKEDLQAVWQENYDGYLDYVTGWFKKSADYYGRGNTGEWAFVSTNSIAQGQPVPALFKPLLSAGWRIKFAHQTFDWASEAPGPAAVHCVITGWTKDTKKPARLFTYSDIKGEPSEQPVKNINPYLVDLPNLFVEKRMKPLSSAVPEIEKGSQPTDDGGLVVELDEYNEVASDPLAAKYLRPYVGAKELIRGENVGASG